MNSNKTVAKAEPARHWINGEWISSSNVAESVSPSTGEVLGQYSAGGRVEAAAAIAAARKAFDTGGWSHDPQLRSRALLELADRLVERADAIALTISREEGKTLGEATLEATWSPSTLRYNAGTALSQTGTSAEIAPGVFATAMREPIGVAGIIVPWNSPLALDRCRDRAATRCNSLDLNGTDSPFLILQETLWPTYWTQIGPRFLGTLSATS
jgi:betaine-aldehyde dehydrogenase